MQEESKGLKLAIKTHWSQLEVGQKSFFVIFVFCSVGALVFSYLNVRDGVYAPFRVSIKDIAAKKDMLKDPATEQVKLAKRIDTDGDGLSDWEEENVYHTSPYLWSTAGDNVPDNVKLAMGENPLCKLGEPCTAQAMTFNLPTTTFPLADVAGQDVRTSLGDIFMGDSPVGQNFRDTASDAGINLDLNSAVPRDPILLRQALLQTGKVTTEQLDNLTDDQLLKYFDEAKAELEKQNPNLKGTASSTKSGQLITTPPALQQQLNAVQGTVSNTLKANQLSP
jgi:hypothetical protein